MKRRVSDYTKIGAVCSDCARRAGFTPKRKTVGVWIGACGICHEQKPCTDLWHDWMLTKKDREWLLESEEVRHA